MHPPHTYELRVEFAAPVSAAIATKQTLIDWLLVNGVESFVEGDLDVSNAQVFGEPHNNPDRYDEFGGDAAPVSVYRYSRESLDDLNVKLKKEFGARVTTSIHTMETEVWMEGWKEGFKPFSTGVFHVRPPWVSEQETPVPPNEIKIVIEPGMAFGTGQHATTRLCLDELGQLAKKLGKPLGGQTVLDVGTGTGILAIGAKLMGYGTCLGSDIEDDAILAARENAKVNHADIEIAKMSVPAGKSYDLVLANILAVVLIKLMPQLAAATKNGGHLIMSGLLVEEADEVTACAVEHGFVPDRLGQHEGWGCIVVRRA